MALVLLACLQSGCATGPSPQAARLSDEAWSSLASPRPAPLSGAARLSIGEVRLLGEPAWPAESPVRPSLGLAELIAAGLLRRADVHFVERRRFSAAVEAERTGAPRGPGAPPVGVSPGAQVSVSATWAPLAADQATLEIRLTDLETGAVLGSGRSLLPTDADAVALARAAVGAVLDALAEHDRLPPWADPAGSIARGQQVPSGVPTGAVADFMRGLEAEERWAWESARRAYQAAAGRGGFLEAEAALARTARLRLGGTLGES